MRQNAAANASQRYVTDAAERENNYNTDAALRQAIYGIDANERMNNYNTDASTRMNADDNYTSRYNAALGLEGTKYGIDSNERISNAELKENGRQFDRQYDIQNLLAQNTAPAEETTYTPRLTAAQAYKAYNDAVKNGNSVTDSVKQDYEYWYGSQKADTPYNDAVKAGANAVKNIAGNAFSMITGKKANAAGTSGSSLARDSVQANGVTYRDALSEGRIIVEDAQQAGRSREQTADELMRYLSRLKLNDEDVARIMNELLGE